MRRQKFFVFALKDDRIEQCLRSFWGRITNVGSKAKEITKYHESCVSVVGFSACRCQKKSVLYETECRLVAFQLSKQDQQFIASIVLVYSHPAVCRTVSYFP